MMSSKIKTLALSCATVAVLGTVIATQHQYNHKSYANKTHTVRRNTQAKLSTSTTSKTAPAANTHTAATTTGSNPTSVQQIANQATPSVDNAVTVINNNVPILKDDITWTVEHFDYGNLDNLNRATTATAYLTNHNLGKSKGREAQQFKPTGWSNQSKTVNGERVFPQNRGHLIAYTVTFNLDSNGKQSNGATGSIDNPKNLFTQSAYSNQKLMQTYEQQVRDALAARKQVIYQVTPVFKDNELMARGVWLQAKSMDNSMHFNVYIANVQPGLTFDYATGRSKTQ